MTGRKVLRAGLLGFVGLFALFGATVAATADHDTEARYWLFGDCDARQGEQVVASGGWDSGCRGFGIVFGELDDEQQLVNSIINDAPTPYFFVVKHAYAFKVGGQFVSPIVYLDEEASCEDSEKVTADQLMQGTPGLWLAWFEIEVCDEPI